MVLSLSDYCFRCSDQRESLALRSVPLSPRTPLRWCKRKKTADEMWISIIQIDPKWSYAWQAHGMKQLSAFREGAEDLAPPILPAAPPSYNEVFFCRWKLTKTDKFIQIPSLTLKLHLGLWNFFVQAISSGPLYKDDPPKYSEIQHWIKIWALSLGLGPG